MPPLPPIPIPARLGQARVSILGTVLYTVPPGLTATLRHLTLTNTTGGADPGVFNINTAVDVRVWVYLVPPGGVADETTLYGLTGREIPPTGATTDDGIHTLEAGESIVVACDPDLGVTARASGSENHPQ